MGHGKCHNAVLFVCERPISRNTNTKFSHGSGSTSNFYATPATYHVGSLAKGLSSGKQPSFFSSPVSYLARVIRSSQFFKPAVNSMEEERNEVRQSRQGEENCTRKTTRSICCISPDVAREYCSEPAIAGTFRSRQAPRTGRRRKWKEGVAESTNFFIEYSVQRKLTNVGVNKSSSFFLSLHID